MLASLSPHGVCHIEASPVWTLGTAPGRRADRVRQRRAERNAYRRVSRMAVSGVEAAVPPRAPGRGPVPVSKRRRQASTRFYSHMSKLKVLSFVGADPIHQTLGPGHRLRRCARTCAPRRRRASAVRAAPDTAYTSTCTVHAANTSFMFHLSLFLFRSAAGCSGMSKSQDLVAT